MSCLCWPLQGPSHEPINTYSFSLPLSFFSLFTCIPPFVSTVALFLPFSSLQTLVDTGAPALRTHPSGKRHDLGHLSNQKGDDASTTPDSTDSSCSYSQKPLLLSASLVNSLTANNVGLGWRARRPARATSIHRGKEVGREITREYCDQDEMWEKEILQT